MVWANALVKALSLEAKPTRSLAFGIFANVLPSLLIMKPFGGHTGDGEGVIFALALANDVVEAAPAPATGMHTKSVKSMAKTFLITIPLKLSNTKENTNC